MGKEPDSEAVETDRFQCLEGALACLVADFRVTGLPFMETHPMLF